MQLKVNKNLFYLILTREKNQYLNFEKDSRYKLQTLVLGCFKRSLCFLIKHIVKLSGCLNIRR